MQRCLQLAKLGEGNVAPNPMVGAVLVHKDTIIGEGYHMEYGHAHAEVNCINSVPASLQHLIKESVLYVSLEPCTHFGKTPPCSDLIIKNKIPEAVIACKDPFAKVNGGGIQKLNDAGIKTIVGVLEEEATILNKRFFTFHKKQRPYIILKWAQSNNLKIAGADFESVKISNDNTNKIVHKWRSEEAAIMVGTNTALHDNPVLTTRLWPGKNPVRIVIDKFLKIPAAFHLSDNIIPTIIINTVKQDVNGNTVFYKVSESENLLAVTISILHQRNLTSLLVEGGTVLLQSFIDSGLWDEARLITNENLEIKNGINAPVLKKHQLLETINISTDRIDFYINTKTD